MTRGALLKLRGVVSNRADWRVGSALGVLFTSLVTGCAAPQRQAGPTPDPPPARADSASHPAADRQAGAPGGEALPWWDHPAAFSHRRRITVSTANDAIGRRYTVSIPLDHAGLVREGESLPGGDDLRIARWSGGVWVELHRLVGGSGWNHEQTEIWFALQEPLAPFSTASNYFVYYGSREVLTAPEDPSQIYYYYSNFSSPEAFARDWTIYSVNQEPIEYAIVGGALYKGDQNSTQVERKPFINDKVVLTGTGEKARGLYVRYRYRPSPSRPELDDDLFGVGLCSADAEPAGFYAGITGRDDWYDGSEVTPAPPAESKAAAGYWRGAERDYSTDFSNRLQLDLRSGHTVVAVWTVSSLALWLDGSFISAWPAGPLEDGYFCFASQGMPDLFIDELMLRRLVDSEPVTELGPEQRREVY